jgi:hypothetical protein
MSANTMLPALTHPWSAVQEHRASVVTIGPGLGIPAIESLRTGFPGNLSPEHEEVLKRCCGIDGTALQYIDFTGQWHDEEPLAVFRPCLTLAIDDHRRRWIAETGHSRGLPGPVWCVVSDPQVVVYVSEDLEEFLKLLKRHTESGSSSTWLKTIDAAAWHAWRNRGALAFQSRQAGVQQRHIREWLLQLPRDARVYDLRSAHFGAGWPYGAAGDASRFHRCGREMLFAVSGFPAPRRWADYLGDMAKQHDAPRPAILEYGRRWVPDTAKRSCA